MTRTEMQDAIIRLYGFENRITIDFFKLLEEWEDNEINNKLLELMVRAHMEYPNLDVE